MRPQSLEDLPERPLNWQMVKLIWPYLLEFKSRVLIALGCLILAKVANVLGPWLLKLVVDGLSAPVLVVVPVALILAYGLARLSNVILGEIRDTVFGRVTERAMRRIGLKVFDHLHALDLDFHLNRRTGGLARDIERGTTGISFLMRFFVFNIAPTFIEILMIAGVLFFHYGLAYALIIMASVTVYVIYSAVATEWRTRYVREQNKADSTANTRAVDSLLNYETVKYFGNEQFESERYDRDLEHWEQARRKNRLTLFALNGGQALIIAIATTLMVWLAASEVAAGSMTIGDFVAIHSYMLILFMPLNFLGFVYREIKSSMANIERMFELIQIEPKVRDASNARALDFRRGEIVFEDVHFAYHAKRPILQSFNLHIAAGEKVAIVGASGAGKSTAIKLLFRFYDCSAGRILIDGQDIRELSQASLRQVIGIVPQDTVLFNDSILENVRYGRPSASDEEVKEAIRLAHLESFITQLPEGYATRVGERGLKLSGGEKQRVAIARTILKRPPILCFDEATSSLDSHSEQAILKAIREVSKGHTSLVIAHRLSTIVDADRIVVLNQGQVAEQGRHTDLLQKNGRYAALWRSQQRAQAENND